MEACIPQAHGVLAIWQARTQKPKLWDLMQRGVLDRELLPILWENHPYQLELEVPSPSYLRPTALASHSRQQFCW